MKNYKRLLGILLAFIMLLVPLASCGEKGDKEEDSGDTAFFYSNDIDENGYWQGIKALDYVEMFNYAAMPIPSEVHQISDDELQAEIDAIVAEYPNINKIMNRTVHDGDTVNIDYVGSVDGVEFSGGSTQGMGTDVTIGVTSYIDDFLEQLIGSTPGNTINVEVTFPEDYGVEELNGKDALFITVINYIVEEAKTELTDEYVASNLSGTYGWNTITEMDEGTREQLKETAIQEYIRQYLETQVTVKSIPNKIMKHQENAMVEDTRAMAEMYSMELADLLSMYGFASVDELIESDSEITLKNATYNLVIQAVAEDAGISVSDADFEESGYANYEEVYGVPYLKQYILQQKVFDYILENAVLQ